MPPVIQIRVALCRTVGWGGRGRMREPVGQGVRTVIAATGNGIVDGAADLPGPGAVSLPGTFVVN